MSAASGTDAVVAFLLLQRPDLDRIDPELDLIENRVLDSLHFVEFLLMLEELTGQEILLEDASANDFRTISAIERRFFDGDSAH